ncbi:hypothetical protein PHYSODRAFT_255770 [Phytophthora sojae]|uniref:Uncharacterized protein n=1 Tax=Phytophthora sojae (strain P6497) TaxID=1094619 RepID=G4ZJ96_PHYSP|nr:hypothetical protein PHYSODRAFT_255770 [Phytophthora sojae]EGZ17760.1 hypothetical protein PHYSODRAFT_255770 [Phytophthora sojae]|eukprot:XP_009526818.1 hypothetical protein PHYSODRAFT_255770 [Phytophthora sojae]
MQQITRVENAERWFTWRVADADSSSDWRSMYPQLDYCDFCLGFPSERFEFEEERDAVLLQFVRELSELKIGEVSTRWDDNCQWEHRLPIDFQHAKIRVGDVFDYYTTSEGVLEIPKPLSRDGLSGK